MKGEGREQMPAGPDSPADSVISPARSALTRSLMLFALWLVLMQSIKIADLALGVCATLGATWVSMRLLPPEFGRLRFGSMLSLLPHFLWESVLAGFDVARRALSPQLKLHPGFVNCPLGFGPGIARNTFATITSLLPGTVACGETAGELVYHCTDTTQPVVKQLWDEERRLSKALVAGRSCD